MMKKQYEAPAAEVIEFDYREQVVASGDRPVANFYDDEHLGWCEHPNS